MPSTLRFAGIERRLPDGNPPSGVASGYVCFDVMALLLAPRVLAGLTRGRTEVRATNTAAPLPAASPK
jgi:hypothetical protein